MVTNCPMSPFETFMSPHIAGYCVFSLLHIILSMFRIGVYGPNPSLSSNMPYTRVEA